MIKLETLLPADELASFHELVAQAHAQGAGAVSWHSSTAGIVVIGFCRGGELLTWFATPAATDTEAAVARAVILAGVTQASHTMTSLASGAYTATEQALAKAMH